MVFLHLQIIITAKGIFIMEAQSLSNKMYCWCVTMFSDQNSWWV